MATKVISPKRVLTLANNEKVKGFTHRLEISGGDFTEATANTAETFQIPIPKGTTITGPVLIEINTPFAASGDAAFNSTTVSVGHDGAGGSATVLAAAVQANKNGSVVTTGVGTGAQLSAQAAINLTVTVNSMAGKSLSAIDEGQVVVWVPLALPEELH